VPEAVSIANNPLEETEKNKTSMKQTVQLLIHHLSTLKSYNCTTRYKFAISSASFSVAVHMIQKLSELLLSVRMSKIISAGHVILHTKTC